MDYFAKIISEESSILDVQQGFELRAVRNSRSQVFEEKAARSLIFNKHKVCIILKLRFSKNFRKSF